MAIKASFTQHLQINPSEEQWRWREEAAKFIYDDSEKHLTVAYLHRMIYDLSHILS